MIMITNSNGDPIAGPFSTFAEAVAAMQPGDRCSIQPGVYEQKTEAEE